MKQGVLKILQNAQNANAQSADLKILNNILHLTAQYFNTILVTSTSTSNWGAFCNLTAR